MLYNKNEVHLKKWLAIRPSISSNRRSCGAMSGTAG